MNGIERFGGDGHDLMCYLPALNDLDVDLASNSILVVNRAHAPWSLTRPVWSQISSSKIHFDGADMSYPL